MPQGYQITIPRMRFDDVNGEPLSLGKIYFYESGTETPQDTWSDSALSSLNTNPVILSASGECTIFVPQGDIYTVDVFDADDVHQAGWPVDGVIAIPAAEPAPAAPDPIPIGCMVWSPYSTTPTGGYLPANGATVSRVTYAALAALAAADGYPNGNGNGTTTFELPDLRGRAPYGLAASGTGSTLGGTFGSFDHTHDGGSHTHSVVVTRDGWGAALNIPSTTGRLNTGDAAGTGQFNSSYQPTADLTVTSAAGGTGITGTANPPVIAGYWFIKALAS